MTTTLIAWLWTLGVGPHLDPLAGEEVTAVDRQLLPSGRHLGYLADVWFVDLVSQQQNGGGIATFDRLQVSAHGHPWAQMRFWLEGVDITDPAQPGSPLLNLPHWAWSSLRYQSHWTDKPGFQWEMGRQNNATGASVRAGGGGAIGGPTLIPVGWMDREPASRSVSGLERRSLERATEVMGEAAGATLLGRWRVLAEEVTHTLHYPTLGEGLSGRQRLAHAERSTLVASGSVGDGPRPLELALAWQGQHRSHQGAEYRFPENLTAQSDGNALVSVVNRTVAIDGRWRVLLHAGMGWRSDLSRLRTQEPVVTDLEGEWLLLARPVPSERLTRQRLNAGADLVGGDETLRVRASVWASHAELVSRVDYPGGRTGVTYVRGAAAPDAPVGVSMTVYDPTHRAEERLRDGRGELELVGRTGRAELRVLGALDVATVGTPVASGLEYCSPAWGLATTHSWGETRAFLVWRHEPEALTAQAAAFLNKSRPSGYRYAWLDDGDRVPEAGEQGALLARTGGMFHVRGKGLRRPTGEHLAMGMSSPRFGPLRASLAGVGHLRRDRFTVRMRGAAADSFESVPFYDPGGDGRGEVVAPGGGQDLVAYARLPGTEGQERYALVNAGQPDFYLGAEAQLLSVEETWWFVNLGGIAYWLVSGAPFGSFPDRNDPSVIHEVSADPNARINARGRPDADRSFGINLLAGVRPLADMSAAVALRYRDGQPFTRIVVAELPQGPTPIMAVARGAPRHTFHMTLDARIRYAWMLGEWQMAIYVDGFNLLGSGTEILEDPRTDSFRRPLEMVPGRAGFATVEIGWQP